MQDAVNLRKPYLLEFMQGRLLHFLHCGGGVFSRAVFFRGRRLYIVNLSRFPKKERELGLVVPEKFSASTTKLSTRAISMSITTLIR